MSKEDLKLGDYFRQTSKKLLIVENGMLELLGNPLAYGGSISVENDTKSFTLTHTGNGALLVTKIHKEKEE